MSLLLMVAKLFIGFIVLMMVLRWLGKKELASASPLDVVYAVALGDLIVDGAYDEKVTIWQVMLGIIMNGQVLRETLNRHRLSLEEVESLLRQKGVFDVKQVELGIMETNGEISLLKAES